MFRKGIGIKSFFPVEKGKSDFIFFHLFAISIKKHYFCDVQGCEGACGPSFCTRSQMKTIEVYDLQNVIDICRGRGVEE